MAGTPLQVARDSPSMGALRYVKSTDRVSRRGVQMMTWVGRSFPRRRWKYTVPVEFLRSNPCARRNVRRQVTL